MIYISASYYLYDLRMVRARVAQHTADTFCRQDLESALATIDMMIKEIEDVAITFTHPQRFAPPQDGMG